MSELDEHLLSSVNSNDIEEIKSYGAAGVSNVLFPGILGLEDCRFSNIPLEVLAAVVGFLDVKSVGQLSATCRSISSSMSHDCIWKEQIAVHFFPFIDSYADAEFDIKLQDLLKSSECGSYKALFRNSMCSIMTKNKEYAMALDLCKRQASLQTKRFWIITTLSILEGPITGILGPISLLNAVICLPLYLDRITSSGTVGEKTLTSLTFALFPLFLVVLLQAFLILAFGPLVRFGTCVNIYYMNKGYMEFSRWTHQLPGKSLPLSLTENMLEGETSTEDHSKDEMDPTCCLWSIWYNLNNCTGLQMSYYYNDVIDGYYCMRLLSQTFLTSSASPQRRRASFDYLPLMYDLQADLLRPSHGEEVRWSRTFRHFLGFVAYLHILLVPVSFSVFLFFVMAACARDDETMFDSIRKNLQLRSDTSDVHDLSSVNWVRVLIPFWIFCGLVIFSSLLNPRVSEYGSKLIPRKKWLIFSSISLLGFLLTTILVTVTPSSSPAILLSPIYISLAVLLFLSGITMSFNNDSDKTIVCGFLAVFLTDLIVVTVKMEIPSSEISYFQALIPLIIAVAAAGAGILGGHHFIDAYSSWIVENRKLEDYFAWKPRVSQFPSYRAHCFLEEVKRNISLIRRNNMQSMP